MTDRLAILVVAGAVALTVASSAAGAGLLAAPGTIRISDRLVKRTHVNLRDRGTDAGDLDFYRQLLFNKRITVASIGHSDITCIDTGTGSLNCTGTYFLPKGKIMVGGVIDSRLFYQFAVLGGTGLYDNVRGTLTATYMGGVPAQELLLFRLVL